MSFSRWLRVNSEHYLTVAAQARIACRHGVTGPAPARGAKAFFWLRVFVPAYRLLPWKLRHAVMRSMPGSHRRQWTYPKPPTGPAIR